MSTDDWYRDLLDRVAKDDAAAVAEFVERYRMEIRTMVRAWLRPWEASLRQLFDSEDICQSILAQFLLKGSAQRYDLESPEQLRRLFTVMVRNRVYDHVRRVNHDRANVTLSFDMPGKAHHPVDDIAEREFRDFLQSKLSAEEVTIAERRFHGSTWQDIANELGGSADARRMQFTRLATRLLSQAV